MLELHNLPSKKGKTKKRLGRGDASGGGSYSGRGMKGQRSRSGGKGGLKLRGLKQSIMKLPKARGFKSGRAPFQGVNLYDLNAKFEDGATVDSAALLERGLISDLYGTIKVLGDGKLKKKLTIKVQAATAGAKEAVEAAGGTIEIVAPTTRPATSKKAEKSADKAEETAETAKAE